MIGAGVKDDTSEATSLHEGTGPGLVPRTVLTKLFKDRLQGPLSRNFKPVEIRGTSSRDQILAPIYDYILCPKWLVHTKLVPAACCTD